MKADPFLFCTIGQMGAIAGGIVPWAPTGVVGISKAAEAGYTENIAMPLFINTTIGTIFVSILLFILYRGWRIQGAAGGQKWKDIPKFDHNQWLTMLAILVMVVCVIVFKTDIGLTSFLLACSLVALKVADMGKCVNAIPWNTVLLVVGMIPTIPSILEHLGPAGTNLPPALMVSAVTVGSSCAGISPASTGGGLIMASLAGDLKDHNIPVNYNKLFIKLFLTSIFSVMMAVLFALIGGYNFTPYG